LPFADAVQQRAREARARAYRIGGMIAVGTVVVVVSLAVLGYGWPAFITAIAGLCATTGAFTVGSRPPGAVGLSLHRNGRAVELRQVAPEFVDAYHRAEAARRTARRMEASVSP
jgi:hypothetical protein